LLSHGGAGMNINFGINKIPCVYSIKSNNQLGPTRNDFDDDLYPLSLYLVFGGISSINTSLANVKTDLKNITKKQLTRLVSGINKMQFQWHKSI
jgi:hypothetical protein